MMTSSAMLAPRSLLLTLIVGGALLLLLSIVFAAWTLVARLRFLRAEARREAAQARWQRAVMDVLTGAVRPERLLPVVAHDEQDAFLEYVSQLAARLRGEEVRRLQALARPFLLEVAARVRKQLRRRDPPVRARLLHAAAVLGSSELERELLAGLDDRSPLVAMVAVRAMSRPLRAKLVGHVLRRLDRYAQWSADQLAATLAGFGAEAASAIRRTLESTAASPRTRTIAADALARLNDAASADLAARTLAKTTDVELISACLRLIERVGRAEHCRAVRALAAHESASVRLYAVGVLAELGGDAESPVLARALRDPSPWVGLRAAAALRRHGRHDVLAAAASGSDRASEIAREALHVMGRAA